jgi:hypothetical protein
MKLRGGEFSTGTTGIFQPELTMARFQPHYRSPVNKKGS